MFCFKKALCLTVSTCVQFYHQEPLKHLFCIVRIKKKERKDIPQKKILLCENDIANINMFSQFSILQFLSREVKGEYELQFARAQQEIAYVPG